MSLVSSAVGANTDMIALWPNDRRPTHLFVCVETSTNAVVQRVDLSQPADSNATTILSGLVSCDPIRRTPWGSLIAAEEANDGGVYEIFDPLSITSAVTVSDRAAGTTSDPRVVKRKALGMLAFEGNPVLPDGTIIFGDELRPGSGNPGGAIFKFVPDILYEGGGVITVPAQSPFVSGHLFGLKSDRRATTDRARRSDRASGFRSTKPSCPVSSTPTATSDCAKRKRRSS